MAANPLPAANTAFLTICKKAYKPMVSDHDPCLIVNIGALKNGLLALAKEDASDLVRAEQYWEKCRQLLKTEEANDVGASAEGTISVEDDFAMSEFGNELDAGVLRGWP